jgi:FkbH-like protein
MELDLGLDSFVFWDDNPVERDKLKMNLPDVKTIDVPQDIVDWPSRLRGLDFFAKFYLNKDDLNKTQQYHNRAKFIRDKTDVVDEKTYLKSIKLTPTIYGLDESNINRATQLCNKTNQFNLRTIRHTTQDLMDMNNQKKGLCFVVGLTDVYGEHGIVGLVCLKIIRPHTIFIDTFLMSCRVIGRHLESWMLNEIVNYCKNNGFTRLIGEYISSKNNILVEQFYEQHNFKLLEENELLEGVSTASASGSISRLYEYKMDDNKIPFMEIYEKDQHF